jgi:hypothetical protein
MLVVKPDDRLPLMKLQGHPWLKGLDQLGTNIAPQPIVFQISRSIAGFAKFKRRKTAPRPDILAKCADLGIDVEQLKADLATGETTPDTTTYFVLCQPISERPVIRTDPVKPPDPERATVKAEEGLPALNPNAPPRRGSNPLAASLPRPRSNTLASLPQFRSTAGRGSIPLIQKSPSNRK